MIRFPSNPSIGQIYTVPSGESWVWNGYAWDIAGGGPGGGGATGPTGPEGPAGAQGPEGPPGPAATGGSGNAVLTADVRSSVTAGAIDPGRTMTAGTDFQQFVEALLLKDNFPSFSAPTFALSSGLTPFQLIGASLSFTLTFTFGRGSINGKNVGGIWVPSAFQDFRAGAAEYYVINSGSQQINNTRPVSNYIVVRGSNTFSGSVTYLIGPQPFDSNGLPFGSPLPAGTEPKTTSFEGVYPIKATTVNIGTLTDQTLVSMLSPPSKVEYTLVAQPNPPTQKWKIAVPINFAKSLSKIYYYNTAAQRFDPVDKLPQWNQTIQIFGGVSYNVYTEGTSLSYGQNRIEFYF